MVAKIVMGCVCFEEVEVEMKPHQRLKYERFLFEEDRPIPGIII